MALTVSVGDREITVYKGTTKNIRLTVVEEDLMTRVDLTGATVFFCVKEDICDANFTFQKGNMAPLSGVTLLAQVDPTIGQLDVVIDPADTADLTPGTYCYDIKIVLPSGTFLVVTPTNFFVKATISE